MDDDSLILKDEYVNVIMYHLQNNDTIPDDIVYLFYSKTLEVVQAKAYYAVTRHAKDFCLYMSNLWRSHTYLNDCSPTLVFQLGELHTCARMLDNLFEEQEKEHQFDLTSKWLSNKSLFFQLIDENPGIKQSALAKEMSVSKSSLSQFTARIRGYGLYYERTMGREKYYFLTSTGTQLLKQMKQEQQKKAQEEELLFWQDKYSRLLRCLYNLFSISFVPKREKRLLNELVRLNLYSAKALPYSSVLSKQELVDNYRSFASVLNAENKLDSRLQMAKERTLLLEFIVTNCLSDIKINEKQSILDQTYFSYVVQLDDQPEKKFENTAPNPPLAVGTLETTRPRSEKTSWANNINSSSKPFNKSIALIN